MCSLLSFIIVSSLLLFSRSAEFDGEASLSLDEPPNEYLNRELNLILNRVAPAQFFRPDFKKQDVSVHEELSESFTNDVDAEEYGDITRHDVVDISPVDFPLDTTEGSDGVTTVSNTFDGVATVSFGDASTVSTTTPRLLVFAKHRRLPTIVFPPDR